MKEWATCITGAENHPGKGKSKALRPVREGKVVGDLVRGVTEVQCLAGYLKDSGALPRRKMGSHWKEGLNSKVVWCNLHFKKFSLAATSRMTEEEVVRRLLPYLIQVRNKGGLEESSNSGGNKRSVYGYILKTEPNYLLTN